MNLLSRWLGKEKKEAGPKKTKQTKSVEALTPDYFERKPLEELQRELGSIFKWLRLINMVPLDQHTLKIDFMRDGEAYQAQFKVTPEGKGATYRLEANFVNGEGESFFTKDIGGLNYERVEHSLKLAFSSAFMGK